MSNQAFEHGIVMAHVTSLWATTLRHRKTGWTIVEGPLCRSGVQVLAESARTGRAWSGFRESFADERIAS